jgi:hypothetical protein
LSIQGLNDSDSQIINASSCLKIKLDDVNEMDYLFDCKNNFCLHNLVQLENPSTSLSLLKAKCAEVLLEAKRLSESNKNNEAIELIENFINDNHSYFKEISQEEKKINLFRINMPKIIENNEEKFVEENINYTYINDKTEISQLKKDLDNFILALDPKNYNSYGKARVIEYCGSHMYQRNKACDEYEDYGLYSNKGSKKFYMKSRNLKERFFIGT